MKTLQRALNLTVGASIACWILSTPKIEAAIIICLMLVIILPITAQFDRGGDNEQ